MYTALFPATINNRTDVIKRLSHAGADENRPNQSGSPPLHFASNHNYARVPRLLIDEKADINLKNKRNQTTLDYRLKASS